MQVALHEQRIRRLLKHHKSYKSVEVRVGDVVCFYKEKNENMKSKTRPRWYGPAVVLDIEHGAAAIKFQGRLFMKPLNFLKVYDPKEKESPAPAAGPLAVNQEELNELIDDPMAVGSVTDLQKEEDPLDEIPEGEVTKFYQPAKKPGRNFKELVNLDTVPDKDLVNLSYAESTKMAKEMGLKFFPRLPKNIVDIKP